MFSGLSYGGRIRPDQPDRKLFDYLAAEAGETLISLYLPTHVRGAEINQDRIRLKNRISDADDRLETAGRVPDDRSEHLASARSLLEDEEFWRHQGNGLAVFVDDEGETTTASLGHEPAELSVVAPVFHLRPLATSLPTTELWTLVLTKGGVRLYLVSKEAARRAEVDLPESFGDVNWFVDREKQRQRHPDRTGTDRARHGHEGGYVEEDLKRFMRAVADALPAIPGSAPLLVMGDDVLASRFANTSDREVLSPANSGIIDVDDLTEIREKAAPVIENHESSQIEAEVGRAREQLGTGDAITILEEALKAAVAGRISTLLIQRDADPVWGTFDPSSLEIARQEREESEVDLLDRLVVHAMGTGAEITTRDGPIDDHVFVAIPRF